MAASSIIYLQHHQVDKQQWDNCIRSAANTLIYGYSFYLDALAPGWNAVVDENYKWVMPLPNKRKFGISYLYQPPFVQQLGVFAKSLQDVPLKEIAQLLQTHYRFCEVQWNYATPGLSDNSIQQTPATNFILDLNSTYEPIRERYTKDLKRNLQRGSRFQFTFKAIDDYALCIRLYRQYYGERIPHVKSKDYAAFAEACKCAAANDMLICRQVVNENDEVLALALLLNDGKRLYNMMNTTTAAGRKTEANHVLLDAIIKEFSGQDLIFDFEGSDLDGVKAFYRNFAPANQPYYHIKYNLLPWPVRLLKN
jgi:hypothetical protein